MALERQSIEKKDFPIGHRGYDPDAVDAHLSWLAGEIDELKVSSRRRTETIASAVGDQVRAIVETAERSAAEMQRQAEADAHETRAEAAADAQATRERATEQAREYVGKVTESVNGMLQRLDAMESELRVLGESLRAGAGRLTLDVRLLETTLGEVREAAGPQPGFEPEVQSASTGAADVQPVRYDDQTDRAPAAAAAVAPSAAEAGTEGSGGFQAGDGGEGGAGAEGGEAAGEPDGLAPAQHLEEAEPFAEDAADGADAAGAGTGAPAEGHPATGSDDTEGARLIALNMALNGTPRDETDRYLAENFELSDRGRLLDEVYASVQG